MRSWLRRRIGRGRGRVGIHFENREGLAEYNIPRDFHRGREPGLSAMIRLKNEQEWIGPCLESIREIFDEIVITLQNSTDRSEEIIRSLAYPHVRIYHYPFDSYPNGPGHDRHPADSVHTRAYYYNWSLARTTREWVCKWDGDMVAMDWLGERVRSLIRRNDIIFIKGVNLVGPDLCQVSEQEFTGAEPRFFRVARDTFYYPGPLCEEFTLPRSRWGVVRVRTDEIPEPGFLHFKWAKPLASMTKAWPENWREMDHFQKLILRRDPAKPYEGEYPAVIRRLRETRAAGVDGH